MKLLKIKQKMLLFILLLGFSNLYGQTNPFEVIDRFGNSYTYEEIQIGQEKTYEPAGLFKLYFDATLLSDDQEAVIIQVFTDLSYLVRENALLPTGDNEKVAIQILNPDDDMPDYALAGATPYFFELGPGVTSGTVWEYINTGADPLANIGLGNNFHGFMMVRNEVIGEHNWYVSSTEENITGNDYDFYTVILHEAMHMLGFYSTILGDGRSSLSDWNTSGEPGLYSMFDTHLYHNGTKVIDEGSCYDITYNTSLDLIENCNGNLHFVFDHDDLTDYEVVYTANPYELGSSNSHFLCSTNPTYLMTTESTLGNTCRYPNIQEVRVLQAIGYEVTWVFGSDNHLATKWIYTNPNDPDNVIAAANDIKTGSDYTYQIELGEQIDISIADIILNDYSIEGITGIEFPEIVIGGYDDVLTFDNLTESGTLTFQSGTMFTGNIYIKYRPVNTDLNLKGNMAYIVVHVNTPPLPTCGDNECNLICNGDFDNLVLEHMQYFSNIYANSSSNNSIDLYSLNVIPNYALSWISLDCSNWFLGSSYGNNPPKYYNGSEHQGKFILKSSLEAVYFELNDYLDITKDYTLFFKSYSYNDSSTVKFYMSSSKPCTYCDLISWSTTTPCNGGEWSFEPILLSETAFVPSSIDQIWHEYSIQITSEELNSLNQDIKYLIIPNLGNNQSSELYFDDFVLTEDDNTQINVEAVSSNYSPCVGDEFTITYTLTVPDGDPIPEDDIIFDYYRPTNIDVLNSGNFTVNGDVYSHTIDFTEPTYTFDVVLRVNSAIPAQAIENIGAISSANVCSNYSNTNSVTITPQKEDALTLDISSIYNEGSGQITYNVSVTNNIDKSFQNVHLFSDLTSDIDFDGSDYFTEIGTTNQIEYIVPELLPLETRTYSFTASVVNIAYHENTTCIEVVSGACDISDCVSTYINEPLSDFVFTAEETPIYCEGTNIWYRLSGSDFGVDYTLIRYYNMQTDIIETFPGIGADFDFIYTANNSGDYEVYASFQTPQQTKMTGDPIIDAYPYPEDKVVEGDKVCEDEDATVTVFDFEAGVTYSLLDYTNYTQELVGNDIVFTISPEELEIGNNEILITASIGNCDRTLKSTVTVNALPETNFVVSAPSIIFTDTETEICLETTNPNYEYTLFINGLEMSPTLSGNDEEDICFEINHLEQGENNISVLVNDMYSDCNVFREDVDAICVVKGALLDISTVTGNIVINNVSNYLVVNDIVIEENASLTLRNAGFTFASDVQIIVNPGGKLIIDRAKLTNSCGEMWQGITVLGNSDQDQQTESNQGVIEVKNGAIIENAKSAIYVGNPDSPSDGQAGGIVKIDGATFKNNKACVEMPRYHNFSFGNPEIHRNNVSYIRNSTFETTDFLANQGVNPYAFIALWEVDGISISNNTFTNLKPEMYYYSLIGSGIVSDNASFRSSSNTFENLTTGIKLKKKWFFGVYSEL